MLKGISVEVLQDSIRHNMWSYLGLEKSATVNDQARHATSLTKLQRGSSNKGAVHDKNRIDECERDSGPKAGNANTVRARGSSSTPSSSCTRSRTATDPLHMIILHEQQTCH